MPKEKKVFKVTKTWYVEATNIMELTKDKLATMRKDAAETKIFQIRED